MNQDEKFMKAALKEAQKAALEDEVPVGCVVVQNGKIIARGRNRREKTQCATRHAEMIAVEKACKKVGYWRLYGCTLYVTLEPCPMCAGALVNARVERLVFGAYDQKAGAAQTLYNIPSDERLNHRMEVVGGVLENPCKEILSEFFRNKRKNKKKEPVLFD
ncbi:MAG: tRNA adenosine(34) deaminase TadA [Clostridia bacterium]|nr:tRNA adenosine(34) deaminase TadA [Clostridia bacterium]